MRFNTVFLLIIASLAVAVPSAMAAKGGSGGGGTTSASPSISIAQLNGSSRAASTFPFAPAYQDTVTWATTTGPLPGSETAEVVLSCYQDLNGDGVVDTTLGGPDQVYGWIGSPGAVFSFNGQGQTSEWSVSGGGPAICRADLDAYSRSGVATVLATTGDFPVAG